MHLPGKRFVVTINLMAKSFVPGKKLFERVVWCLTDRIDLSLPFILAFVSNHDGADRDRHDQSRREGGSVDC